MVDLDTEIYRLLNKQIKINEFRYLSSGDDSDTFLCNEQYVVKVPKRDSVRIAQKREFELYRFLENCNLSYQTPAVVYQSDQFNIMKYIKTLICIPFSAREVYPLQIKAAPCKNMWPGVWAVKIPGTC